MGRSKHSKPQSLTALAASLDTRKRPAPADSARGDAALLIEKALRSKPPLPSSVAPPPPKVVSAPVRAPAPAKPPAGSTLQRSAALTSLQRAPSLPGKLPQASAQATRAAQAEIRRQYPRAEIQVKARLSLADDPSRSFEAALPTVNLSVGGMFLESSFFLKLGTRLLIQLQLPHQKGRLVKVKGEVVRVESGGKGASGFALRFSEYLDGSQVTLATHFLSPVLREFLSQYAREHRFDASAEYLAHTADVLAAWELKKAELGGDVWDLFSARA